MKTINTYINEKLVIGDNLDKGYNYFPKTKDGLIKCIKQKINKEGLGTEENPLNLNDINTSEITDMSNLFAKIGFNCKLQELSINGYFNISDWDVSNVKNMHGMFFGSKFNGDISNWDVSKVRDMEVMFDQSYFDGDISEWNVSNVETMQNMFYRAYFTGKNGDISNWDVSNVKSMFDMFSKCPLEKNPPKWYHE